MGGSVLLVTHRRRRRSTPTPSTVRRAQAIGRRLQQLLGRRPRQLLGQPFATTG